MNQHVACTECGALILPSTAAKTGGRCMPCKQGFRKSMEEAKRRRVEALANPQPAPREVIATIVNSYAPLSDQEVLYEIAALAPLADESDPRWNDDAYWRIAAYPYLALADVAAQRRLRPAIRLLLDRASFGDPGEIMRGMRHCFERIVKPHWSALADICLDACTSPRPGTRLWAMDQLAVLKDPRAQSIFEAAMHDPDDDIKSIAEIGLGRLGNA